jgi:hypothetical protein
MRNPLLLLAILVAALGGLPATGQPPEGKDPPTPSPVRTSLDKVALRVGANTHVSKANEGIHHTESVVAAHPTDAARLFIAAMYDRGVAGYCSDDGGKSWRISLARKGAPGKDDQQEFVCDPAAAFGPDGGLHFVCVRYWYSKKGRGPKFGDPDVGQLEFLCSTDADRTWGPPKSIPTFTDRPWLAIDCTEGKYRGRLYCFATTNKPVLHVSEDGGKTFAKPVFWPVKAGITPRPVTPAVLSDGTVVLLCGLNPGTLRIPLITLLSRDGGASLQEGPTIAVYRLDSEYFHFPQLAADTTMGKYRDRLYAVWNDGALIDRTRRPQTRILFSCSKDKGRSWSEPQVLSEQPTTPEGGKDYGAFLPSIAVNKDGVVAVSWYDRRGLSDGADDKGAEGPRYPCGWNLRLRVSFDGGETWPPSVQVNERSAGKETGVGAALRESAGLAADAIGNFHPVWIDDRTGKRQVWTATVRVGPK